MWKDMGLHEGEDEYHKTTKLLQFFLYCKNESFRIYKNKWGYSELIKGFK